MNTQIKDELLNIKKSKIDNPNLECLIADIKKGMMGRDYNDRSGTHTDYVNNDTDTHTDKSTPYESCEKDRSDHSDITEGDGTGGRRHSHTDSTEMDDSHDDSGHSDYYSDMCR